MSEVVLYVSARNETGKQSSKRLRREGKLPGIFYFHGEDSKTLSVDKKDLIRLLSTEAGVVSLKFADEQEKQCVIREVQYDPVSSAPVHVDFLGIKKGEKLHLVVPVHLIGIPIGVKDDGGILQESSRELEIECLPRDIPEHLEVDVTSLGVGESIHISDLSFENITMLSEPERAVATVVAPRVIREAEPEVSEITEEEEQAEPKVISKGAKEGEESE